jgi:hypothetical protein
VTSGFYAIRDRSSYAKPLIQKNWSGGGSVAWHALCPQCGELFLGPSQHTLMPFVHAHMVSSHPLSALPVTHEPIPPGRFGGPGVRPQPD